MKNKFSEVCILIIVIIIILLAIFVVKYDLFSEKNTANKSNIAVDYLDRNVLSASTEDESDYLLKIEKIAVSVPVIFNVDGGDENKYYPALKNGVAHLQETPKPGEKGNSVIFGHSSQVTDKNSKYAEVFAKLNDLKLNDEIKYLDKKKNKETVYKVIEKKIVVPEEVSVVENSSDTRLTLITCWPIGSNEKRLVVVALLKK